MPLATRRVVTRTVAILGLLGALAGALGPARARGAPASTDAPERVATARAEVGRAAEALESAEDELGRVDRRQAALEAEILALKQRGERSDRLESRLRSSIDAEQALERALAAVDAAREDLARAAGRQVRALDAELRRRAEGLKSGSDAERRVTAAAIRALLETRAWVLETARRAEPPAAELDRDGAAGLPRVEPLDGPEELREKADFADDARDKLRAKRAQLAKLVESRRRTRAIARAARDFAVDVSLFDEELRSAASTGRATATRNESGGSAETPGAGAEAPGAGAPGDLATDGGGGDDMQAPDLPPNFGSGSAETPGRGSGGGVDDGLGGRNPGGAESPAVPSPSAGGPGDVSARSVDPVVLLSLKVDDLAAEGVGVEDLERLLDQYERAEALFSARARAMRARARRLDEAPPDE